MSVRWTILAVLAVFAVVSVVAWLASRNKAMSAAERDLNDRLRALTRASDNEVSHRPRVRAGSLPSITTTKGTK